MTTAEVYWLTRLDNLNGLMITAAIIAGIACLCTPFVFMFSDIADERTSKATTGKFFKVSLVTLAVTASIACFVPTTKELVAIYGISYLTQNKDAREIPAEALKVLNQKLKEFSDDKKD